MPFEDLLPFLEEEIEDADEVLWKVTPLFAEWLSSPTNPLFTSGILTSSSTVLELGCGISPLNAFAMAQRISHYVLSDQDYVQKLVAQNLSANSMPVRKPKSKAKPLQTGDVLFRPLDWEQDEVTPSLAAPAASFDLVLATDCVFNYALVEPFVQTCVDVCALRRREVDDGGDGAACLCVIAQQLRNDEVFRLWLSAFMDKFNVWRVKGELLGALERDGFVVHVGVLRDTT
ncbi:hypothetical protein MAC_09137 [Metarhizium acridum CQMa 102]|uniref:Nicotinamide N-methyltransferase n=1 Tax=Metarhizium acridum (strain CQMa 102) TaxID=655827 RepID=E9EGY9_METAQ|nr:uncharacterized protein MAC_09137 [Metarhizium acridum CQMa 102]EFY84815.1 hypothetical protein MAC_09137 [Metarhizium acridum CQMa 102]